MLQACCSTRVSSTGCVKRNAMATDGSALDRGLPARDERAVDATITTQIQTKLDRADKMPTPGWQSSGAMGRLPVARARRCRSHQDAALIALGL